MGQAVINISSFNCPLDRVRWVAMLYEADLMVPSLFQDVVSIHGITGGEEQLFNRYVRVIMKPPVFLGKKFCNDIIGEFTLCPNPPAAFSDLGPGILLYEFSAPADAKKCEGFDIQEQPRGISRAEAKSMTYACPSKEEKGTLTLVTVLKLDLPVPQWMVPLSLGAKIFVTIARENLKKWKAHLVDTWETQHDLQRRLTQGSAVSLYKAIESIA